MKESTDVARVVDALANGLRSELEIAKTGRLTLERVQLCISFLIAHGCVIEAERSLVPANGQWQRHAQGGERRCAETPGLSLGCLKDWSRWDRNVSADSIFAEIDRAIKKLGGSAKPATPVARNNLRRGRDGIRRLRMRADSGQDEGVPHC